MRIRWKMLLLLLSITLIPMVSAALISRASNRKMGRELTEATRVVLTQNAYRELGRIVDRAVVVLERDRSMVETAVDIQARAVERALARAAPEGGEVHFAQEFDTGSTPPPGLEQSLKHARYNPEREMFEPMGVSYQAPAIRLVSGEPGMSQEIIEADIARLASLGDMYLFVHQRHPELILWQYTTLASGTHSVYPGHGGYPEDYDSRLRPWFALAWERGSALWTPPIIDASTRQVLMVRSRPVFNPDGTFAGVTGIDVPMMQTMEKLELPEAWRDEAKIALTVAVQQQGGEVQLRVMAQQDYASAERVWDMPIELEVLESEDASGFSAMIEDIRSERTSVLRLSYEGRDCLWAFGPIHRDSGTSDKTLGMALMVIVPLEDILAEAVVAEQQMAGLLDEQIRFTGILLLSVIGIVVVIAFLSSRMVTKPLRNLARTAQRISDGDLTARAEVYSRDELGELAQSFNRMVPQLEDRLHLRESLSLAMEVQQHLLPAESPRIDGLEIVGRSVYCDETGGDYYDFLEFAELGPHCLGTAIGDVTGHGIAAALLMATARALLHIRAPQSNDLALVIGDINRHLVQDAPSGKFMTLFFLMLDVNQRSARWVSAGHDPALVYDPPSDTYDELEGSDIPLGVDETWTFTEHSRDGFKPGQIIVMGTDGIWEARNMADEMFGKEKFKQVIREHQSRPLEEIADEVITAIKAFCGKRPQGDDITLMLIRFH